MNLQAMPHVAMGECARGAGRAGALRDATAKSAAAKGGNAMRIRLAAGEKLGRKRMATLAAVYEAEPAVRGVDDIVTDPDTGDDTPTAERRPGPKARLKWLIGSLHHSAAQVVAAAFDQAEHRAPGTTAPGFVDGARHQLDLITAEATCREVTVHIVVDLIHVLEYLWGEPGTCTPPATRPPRHGSPATPAPSSPTSARPFVSDPLS
jgi:hypothetical protein